MKNASIVDYCISSVCLLKYFSNFAVLDFSHFYSDVHCPLAISMSCSAFENAFENNENINLYTHSEKIHKWDQEKCSEFQNQIDLRKIDESKKLLYEVTSMNLNITEGSSSVDKLKINSLIDNLCNILLNSAKSTFGTSEYSKVKHIGKKKLECLVVL